MSTTRPSRAGWARLALALSLLPLLALTGCAAVMANLVKATATEQRSFTASAQPSVIVETYNGPITVKVSSENKVAATVTKTGSGANKEAAEADLKNVGVDYSQDGETQGRGNRHEDRFGSQQGGRRGGSEERQRGL